MQEQRMSNAMLREREESFAITNNTESIGTVVDGETGCTDEVVVEMGYDVARVRTGDESSTKASQENAPRRPKNHAAFGVSVETVTAMLVNACFVFLLWEKTRKWRLNGDIGRRILYPSSPAVTLDRIAVAGYTAEGADFSLDIDADEYTVVRERGVESSNRNRFVLENGKSFFVDLAGSASTAREEHDLQIHFSGAGVGKVVFTSRDEMNMKSTDTPLWLKHIDGEMESITAFYFGDGPQWAEFDLTNNRYNLPENELVDIIERIELGPFPCLPGETRHRSLTDLNECLDEENTVVASIAVCVKQSLQFWTPNQAKSAASVLGLMTLASVAGDAVGWDMTWLSFTTSFGSCAVFYATLVREEAFGLDWDWWQRASVGVSLTGIFIVRFSDIFFEDSSGRVNSARAQVEHNDSPDNSRKLSLWDTNHAVEYKPYLTEKSVVLVMPALEGDTLAIETWPESRSPHYRIEADL